MGKRKVMKDDTSWLVRDARPGGPVDDSVIPSFGGHIAARVAGRRHVASFRHGTLV